MTERIETVADIGESGLIERVAARLGAAGGGEIWAGDDAAVVASAGERLIYTTDLMVEAVDFDLSYCSGADIGWKVVAVNASDVAAMGGRPRQAVTTLALPPDTTVSFVDALLEGLTAAARRWEIDLVGGDISRGTEITIGVALLGALVGSEPVLRSGARSGEAICVTGSLGGSAGGLLALQRGLAGPGPVEGHPLSPTLADAVGRLADRHLRPLARLAEAQALVEIGVSAMIDVSDGLARDLDHLLVASDKDCDELDFSTLPVDPDLHLLAGALSDIQLDPAEAALSGGEDFELLFTIDPARIEDARDALGGMGTELTHLATVVDAKDGGGWRQLERYKEKSWDHLRSP